MAYMNDVCVPNGVAEADMSALTNVAIDTEPDGGKSFSRPVQRKIIASG